jgi:hypothetical protein
MWQLVRNERDRPAASKVGKSGRSWGGRLSVGLQQAATASCGIAVAESVAASARQAVSELKAKLSGDFQHIMVFFSRNYNANELAAAFESEFAGTPLSACSTAGGIGPSGMIEKGIVAVAFPREGFRIHTGLIEDVGSFGVERASSIVHRLKTQLSERAGQKLRDRVFGLMLVDGLSEAEEPLVAAVHWAFDDMQLIGGSSGDGLMFEKTALIHEGRVLSRAAILMMIESEYPFRIFKTDNFEATPVKFVVTAANAEHRVVHELNAEVAAREYASSIGLMLDDLSPLSFASYPLVVKVGGDYYCRSIRNVNADGSLSFYCAIDEGLVFTLARLKDMLRSTQQKLEEVDMSLDGIDIVIGFECVLRRLDAENRQVMRQMEDLYKRYGVVGFHTYGEQLNAMHLNQTLTGIAFGARRDTT